MRGYIDRDQRTKHIVKNQNFMGDADNEIENHWLLLKIKIVSTNGIELQVVSDLSSSADFYEKMTLPVSWSYKPKEHFEQHHFEEKGFRPTD
ncbi:hypothetical protein TNCT_689761 [Trichonephila clavata]|uniref:Uncharacterized protein n=1 Tax=Trichonephila clavata TaxID=2740835 RepID=A0A8X6J444_TRICU|nr:hypothetical protein TNCT_689761 [Trichonephila clavata]